MKPSKHILVLCLAALLSFPLFAKVENWHTYNAEYLQNRTAKKLAHIVIVRPKSIQGKAINIYIDGEYVSSLLPGAYTKEFVCPGKHRVNLAYTNVLTRYKEKRSGGQFFVFNSEHTHYVSIVKKGKSLGLKVLPSEKAKRVADDYTKRQTHTISRVSKRVCKDI